MLNYYELEPDKNTFYSVVADVTHRCNMKCANCYIPNRKIPDMDVEQLLDCIRRFPNRCEIRLLGGEPTLRDDLDYIIKEIRSAGHRPAIMTNGLRLADFEYARSLREAGLTTVNISLNGADDDRIYLTMDKMRCAKMKMTALKNCAELGFFINTNTIMMKGVNDNVPFRIYEMVRELNVESAVLRFRNVAQLGRHAVGHSENFSYEEVIALLCRQFGKNLDDVMRYNVINGYQEERTILFPIDENKKYKTIQIKVTDWSPSPEGPESIPDPGSRRRGRITPDFKVAPFFEHVKLNEFHY